MPSEIDVASSPARSCSPHCPPPLRARPGPEPPARGDDLPDRPRTFRADLSGGPPARPRARHVPGKVNVEVETASIDTLKAERDTDLRTPDFFAVERFPAMTFRSNSVRVQGKAIRIDLPKLRPIDASGG
jgi:hypothetical protein